MRGKAAELSLVGPILSRKRRSRFSRDHQTRTTDTWTGGGGGGGGRRLVLFAEALVMMTESVFQHKLQTFRDDLEETIQTA